MKTILKNKTNKLAVDLAMILCLTGSIVSTSVFEECKNAVFKGTSIGEAFKWGTFHCIISTLFLVIILVHIWQHWSLINTIVSRKLFGKNKILTIAAVLFMLMMISFTLYLTGITRSTIHFHSLVAHFFVFFIIIHLAVNFKKLFLLMGKGNCKLATEAVKWREMK